MQPSECIICSRPEQSYLFTVAGTVFRRCEGCGLIHSSVTGIAADDPRAWADADTEFDAAVNYAAHIQAVCPQGRVLVVCPQRHPLVELLRQQGYETLFLPPWDFAARAQSLKNESIEAAFLLYSLEKFDQPLPVLSELHRLLTPAGALFVATPAVDSSPARLFSQSWIQWRLPNRFIFSLPVLQLLLEKSGFCKIWTSADQRVFSVGHMFQRGCELHNGPIAGFSQLALHMMPEKYKQMRLRANSSGLLATCFKRRKRLGQSLTVVMPVYNEKATVGKALEAVLAKELVGVARRQVLIVESKSSDGSTEIVRSFANHPDVKIIYQEAPRGKGNAVREGLRHATGDIVLIQDADLEYDINDYDELLAPLLRYEQAFVLGSRHQGNWKMRKFTDRPDLAVLMNFGQLLFTWLMNTLYGQRMSDPFTMYKVFRRECLHALKFECDRFDFDHELVIKLVQKGYRPYEIPVNYWSRSYSEGKKVTIFGDPLLWIKANFKYRFTSPFMLRSTAISEARRELEAEAESALLEQSTQPVASCDSLSFLPESAQSVRLTATLPPQRPAELLDFGIPTGGRN